MVIPVILPAQPAGPENASRSIMVETEGNSGGRPQPGPSAGRATLACLHCGQGNPPGVIFCTSCRTNVHWRPDAAAAAARAQQPVRWWTLAVAFPPACVLVGILVALLLIDSIGIGVVVVAGLAALMGAAGSVICALISFVKDERGWFKGALMGYPCGCFLYWVLAELAK